MRFSILALIMSIGGTSIAWSAEVERSITTARAPADAWALAGPFCGIAQWHPAIAECELLTIDGRPYRRLETASGEAFLEREVERDEAGTSYRYAIERSPLPVSKYRSTLRVEPNGAGSRIVWRAEFEVARGKDEPDTVATVAQIYEAGLTGLLAKLSP
jgi:hypothetical protein